MLVWQCEVCSIAQRLGAGLRASRILLGIFYYMYLQRHSSPRYQKLAVIYITYGFDVLFQESMVFAK